MRQVPASEAVNTEEKNEVASSSGEQEQNDGTPWLLEWFPGFDIPIGLEGRAYLRRLLNHRRAENPAACETLLAAHGIKLGRGVPGHTSNWGSMKVRELLHAAYLLGCWSAVEKLCINFCHANGLKTEWIRELKAKGGKQCVTLANLQNYRKKNREKKRPQPAETKEKKPSVAAAVPSSAPVAATASGCVIGASSGVGDVTVPCVSVGDVPTFCKQVEGDNGEDISCSSVVSTASKKSRRTSALSCDQQAPCPYVSTLLGSQRAALPEPTPNSGFEYAASISQFVPGDAQNSMPKHEITVQQGTLNICSTPSSVQLSLPLLCNAPTDSGGLANTDSGNFITAPAPRAFDSASGFTYMVEEDATVASSLTPSSSTSVTRVRRPKRRNGKAKPSGPRKRRQLSTRKSLPGVRTDSFSSIASSEYTAAHVSKSVIHVSAVQMQCAENKFMTRSELIPVSEHQSMAASTSEVTTENRSFYGTWSLQENLSRAAQRTVRTTTSVAPAVARSAARAAANVPRSTDNARQTSSQCCHRWLAASLFWTDSSDNGSSETESLHSRTSTCTTTSSYSDSDHSFHEGCRCSFFKTKQVNFAGKKPAFTCFKTPCSPAEVTEAPFSLYMTAPTAKMHTLDPAGISLAPAWTEVAALPGELPVFANDDASDSRQQRSNSLAEPIDITAGAAVAIHGNSLSAVEGSKPLVAGFWSALPTPAIREVAAQDSQEVCAADAFCGDADATTVHFSPQVTAIDFSASSFKADSETMESAECAQALPGKREDPLKEWNLQERHIAAGADAAVGHADKGKLSSFNRPWETPVQAMSEMLQQKRGGQLSSTRYTDHLRSNDQSAGIRCGTIDYCTRRRSESSGQVVDNAAATEPDICSSLRHEQLRVLQREAENTGDNGSSSQLQQFGLLQREAENKDQNPISLQTQHGDIFQTETEIIVEDKHMTATEGQSEDSHRAMLVKREECSVKKDLLQRATTTDVVSSAPQTSSVIEEGIRSDTHVTHCVRSYVGNLLSSPLPCTETVADTFSFGNYTQRQAQNVKAVHGLDTTSGTIQTVYSTPHFPTKDTWVSYPGGRVGEDYTWVDDLRTESESASVVPSTAPGLATPLFSPRSAALTGSSAAVATEMDVEEAYIASRCHTAEVCSMGEDDVPPNPFPLQLPPLAETQDLFFPRDLPTAEGWESQLAVWRKSSTSGAPDLGSVLTGAAEAQRPTTAASAPENSAASPTERPNTRALSTEWCNVESNVNCCAEKVVFQPPTESGHCANMLEASYEIASGHPGDPTGVPGATVQLTVRTSVVQ